LDAVAKISQPAVNIFNIMGPIAWVVSALGLIKVGHSWYKINKDLDQIKALSAKGKDIHVANANRESLFKLFLQNEKEVALTEDDILGKLHVMGHIPWLESKSKLKEHIDEIAEKYKATKDSKIAKEFKFLIKQQYDMAKVVNCLRIAAVITGLVAMMFFYVPAVKNEKLGWLFLALSNAIAVGSVAFDKLNSREFINEIEELAKKHRKQRQIEEKKKEEEASFLRPFNEAFGEICFAV